MKHSLLSIALVLFGTATAGQPPDAAALLAAGRQALGGDATLAAVTSFTVRGSVTETLPAGGPQPALNLSSSIEISCELPDKYVQVKRRTATHPVGSFEITSYEGFNGSDPIRDVVAPGAPIPVFIPAGPKPTTPAEIAAAKAKLVNEAQRAFARLVTPLFASSMSAYPLKFTGAGQATLPSGPSDILEATGPDGAMFRLFLDATSHLPVQLTWRAAPIVVFSSSRMVKVGPGGASREAPPALPPGDPTVGLPDVEWRIAIADYRLQDGLNWPRRLTVTVDGKPHQDIRFGGYRINPKIDPRTFTPRG